MLTKWCNVVWTVTMVHAGVGCFSSQSDVYISDERQDYRISYNKFKYVHFLEAKFSDRHLTWPDLTWPIGVERLLEEKLELWWVLLIPSVWLRTCDLTWSELVRHTCGHIGHVLLTHCQHDLQLKNGALVLWASQHLHLVVIHLMVFVWERLWTMKEGRGNYALEFHFQSILLLPGWGKNLD